MRPSQNKCLRTAQAFVPGGRQRRDGCDEAAPDECQLFKSDRMIVAAVLIDGHRTCSHLRFSVTICVSHLPIACRRTACILRLTCGISVSLCHVWDIKGRFFFVLRHPECSRRHEFRFQRGSGDLSDVLVRILLTIGRLGPSPEVAGL